MVLVFGIIDPLWALLLSSGLQRRSLHLAMAISPIMIGAAALGVPYGPTGVASCFSAAMSLWLVPHVIWSLKGTCVSPRDLFTAVSKPLIAAVSAGALAMMVQNQLLGLEWPIVRLALSGAVMVTVHLGVLTLVLGEKQAFVDLFRGFRTMPYPSP